MIINLTDLPVITNSDLFQKANLFGEAMIMVENNSFKTEIHPDYNKPKDSINGKVYLFEKKIETGTFSCDIQLMDTRENPLNMEWMGIVFRAQNPDNYELVWIRPTIHGSENVSYLPVAHGLVPLWSDIHREQTKGTANLLEKEWNHLELQLKAEKFTIILNEERIFTKAYTYYLQPGYLGLFVGAGTDAAFKNFQLEI